MRETLGPKMNDVAGSVTKIKSREGQMRKKTSAIKEIFVEMQRMKGRFVFLKKFCNVNLNHYGVLVRTLDDLDLYAYYLMANLF